MLDLHQQEIHFFYTPVDEINNPLLLDRYRSVQSEKERAKVSRYMFEKDRHTSLVTRALVRFVLSEYTDEKPENIEFSENKYGKPSLVPGFSPIPLRFNLSHSGGITACAVALDTEIGMDIENFSRKIDLSVADNFFSKSEAQSLQKSPEKERQKLFFDFWVLKEAYIKAKGRGLSIGLDTFSFSFNDHTIEVKFEDSLRDVSEQWQFFKFSPVDSYMASVAIQRFSKEPYRLHVYKCIPFVGIEKQHIEGIGL